MQMKVTIMSCVSNIAPETILQATVAVNLICPLADGLRKPHLIIEVI